jgi:hypothetical protein
MNWIIEGCYSCNGTGVSADYGGLEGDMKIVSCDSCKGQGYLYVSENDRLALYPGGPLMGSAPGLYKKLKQEMND